MSLTQDYNKELYHYGVKGMKWGKRKNISLDTLSARKIRKNIKTSTKKKTAEIAKKGAEKTAKVLTNIGAAYVTDQVFNGGRGTAIAKAVIKDIGRLTISAYVYARGGRDIKWYDK